MWRDDAYLVDMLIAARRAVSYVADVDLTVFLSDEMRQDAVMRCLEILGEAAGRVSEELRAEHSEVDWRNAIGMRNRLIHEYRHVDPEVVWRTTSEDLPRLVAAVELLVPPMDRLPDER